MAEFELRFPDYKKKLKAMRAQVAGTRPNFMLELLKTELRNNLSGILGTCQLFEAKALRNHYGSNACMAAS
jgi:nitrogen-specific signal transduction histidine kinase